VPLNGRPTHGGTETPVLMPPWSVYLIKMMLQDMTGQLFTSGNTIEVCKDVYETHVLMLFWFVYLLQMVIQDKTAFTSSDTILGGTSYY
jgi:hypothetical protein